ncbi:MAG TPA: CRISPR-associated RAMP protein Csx7 [Thermoanaerobaculia bacterium]|jgi:CRISPR-associated RAMP protein (TIGR02581 family)|nr:CRISPR-associated RAMP protein Csx7 [Thermoanaerobaculia bacterium]
MNTSIPLLDTFQSRVRLEGVLTTWTALHIGAGGSGDALGTDSPVVRTAAGDPYIPGSSLKGVLRSAAEALFRGGAGQASRRTLWSCDPIAGKNRACLTHERSEKLRTEEEERAKLAGRDPDSRKVAEAIWEESCTVCRLFGSLALASRVRFADLPLRGESPLLELRNGVGIDRDKELAARGVLYDFEAVPPETPFDLRVTMDNPTEAEVGLLIYLFQELNAGNLALGGKGSRGLGRVRVEWNTIEEVRLAKENPFAKLLSRRDLLAASAAAPATPQEDPLAGKIPTTGDAEAWRILAEILLALPKIDKGLLAEKAGDKALKKNVLNEKLGLGLDEKKWTKSWDVVLERFAATGLIVRKGEDYALPLPDPTEAAVESDDTAPSGALQRVIDVYVGAMAKLWEGAS